MVEIWKEGNNINNEKSNQNTLANRGLMLALKILIMSKEVQ